MSLTFKEIQKEMYFLSEQYTYFGVQKQYTILTRSFLLNHNQAVQFLLTRGGYDLVEIKRAVKNVRYQEKK